MNCSLRGSFKAGVVRNYRSERRKNVLYRKQTAGGEERFGVSFEAALKDF
jgi:hypothetical protein